MTIKKSVNVAEENIIENIIRGKEMRSVVCIRCKIDKPEESFYIKANGKPNSICDICYSGNYLKLRQIELKSKYEDGDTKIEQCTCGWYFLNEVKSKTGRIILLDKCRECTWLDISINRVLEFSASIKEELAKQERRKMVILNRERFKA